MLRQSRGSPNRSSQEILVSSLQSMKDHTLTSWPVRESSAAITWIWRTGSTLYPGETNQQRSRTRLATRIGIATRVRASRASLRRVEQRAEGYCRRASLGAGVKAKKYETDT